MVPSTMYANAILPVPWTVAQRVYEQRPRRELIEKPPRKPYPKLPQDREAASAAESIGGLLTVASKLSEDAKRLLDDLRSVSRTIEATAEQMRSTIDELTTDIIEHTRILVAASNELTLRFEAASDALSPQLLYTISRLMDASAYGWLGIRLAGEGGLRLDERHLRNRLQASNEPINSSYLSLAAFATQLSKAAERMLDTPTIRLLRTQTDKLHVCSAYGQKKQMILLLPLTGLLLNVNG